MTPADYVAAARVPLTLRPQHFGLWEIRRINASDPTYADGRAKWIGFPSITILCRATMATLHRSWGEVVMEDSRRELLRHMAIWRAAQGRVLVSGLGLGCVVRGLLAKPEVEHIDVVELCPKILSVVGDEFADNPRVRLWLGDALEIAWPAEARWDCAWHDVWCEGPGLHEFHMKLLIRYADRCRRQGAWALPRFARRLAREKGLDLIG